MLSNDIGPVTAGKALSVSHVTVLKWCSGERRPSRDNKKRIAIWTGGAVPEDGWGNGAESMPPVVPFGQTARVA